MNRFCGSCGAARVSAEQAFCQECGTPLAAAAAPAAYPPAPRTGPPATPEYAVPVGLPPASGNGFPVGRVVGAAAVVLALVGAGLVGWQVLGPKGGAESPEQAVRQFVEAAAQQDVLGALDMVNPAEVEGVDDLVAAARERLAEEDLATEDGDLTDALSVELDGLEFDTDELGDSAARVVLRDGSYEVTFDPDGLPDRLAFVGEEYAGDTWRGDILDDLGDDLPDADWSNDRPEPFVSTVRIDGRWYVSALGTYADLFFGVPSSDLGDEGIREPDYDSVDDDVDPVVADEPEDVLDNLVDAANDEDVARLLANFPADEVAALRPWARTFEDIFADEGLTYDVSLEGVDTTVDELGDGLVRLTLDSGTVYGSYQDSDGDYGSGSASVDGRCVSGSDDYSSGSVCIEGDVAGKTGIDSFYLVLREVDGGYQVDPVATAVDYASTVIDSVPSSLFEDALEEIEEDL